jgi:uncharacterized protein YbbC (DUF1343 family)/CubicO group peptidase (beta-lactamase class C family)
MPPLSSLRRFLRAVAWPPHSIVLLLLIATSATARTRLQHAPIDHAIEAAITVQKLPGGVLWIEHGADVYHHAYGRRAIVPRSEPMTEETIFDAASLTKVMATAPSIWILIERGKIGLDEPVQRYIPEFRHRDITIRHLLTHTSALSPDPPLNFKWAGYDAGVKLCIDDEPTNRPGAMFRYSDINFILLGEVVRRVGGETLDRFAAHNIFEPLGMTDTGFLPPREKRKRIAPTEISEIGMLRGIVHDPTSRRMGGVAGHAGLFTTAKDVATYARTLLAGGGTIMKPETVRAMTSVQSPEGVAVKRAGGWDIDSAYSRPRGLHFPPASFGHTGWTGGMIWIDPESRSFYVFLSNRVHPSGDGSVLALQLELGTLVAEALAPLPVTGEGARRAGEGFRFPNVVNFVIGGASVRNGIDVLEAKRYDLLRGRRVGLITNVSGIDRAGNPTIDLLRSAPGVELVALFSPEHGIRGAVDEKVADDTWRTGNPAFSDGQDCPSHMPVYSLYGERRKPSPEQLKGIDTLVFDVQDVGARFYTYISTMELAMEAAAEAKVRFVVLDRVNPIRGDVVEGPMLDGPTDFVAIHNIAVRHGMTVGELAAMFRDEKQLDLDLVVVPIEGWKRSMWQDEAGLPWVNPSPNMRNLRAAALYPGIGLLEHAVSVGRGTPTPFEVVGAPWIDGQKLARELNINGLAFTPERFTPASSMFANQECGGVRITITNRMVRSVDAGLTIAAALARLYPEHFDPEKLQHLLRSPATLEALKRGEVIGSDLAGFLERRQKYVRY